MAGEKITLLILQALSLSLWDLMSSFCAAPSAFFSPVQSTSLDSPLFFCNSNRTGLYKGTQDTKLVLTATTSLSSANPTEQAPAHRIDAVYSNGRFQVKDFVDSIRALPTRERTDFLSAHVEDSEFRTISDFNDLLMALLTAEEPDLALKLFSGISSRGLEPDCWTFSIVSRCYCKKNHLDEAKRVLERMVEERGFHPDVATVTILINGLCKRGRLQIAFEVFDFMCRIGCKPTVQTYNCLLKGLCYVGRVEEAFEMLTKIKEELIKPDIYTYTAVMDGFCKVGRSDEAVELLNEAVEMGLTPNVVTYNTLFNGYCKEGRPLESIGVLKQMKQKNCMPDYISYSTLLHSLLKWGKIRSALRTYKEMVGDGFEADERMMNTLLRGLCRRSWKEKDLVIEAYQLFEKMKNKFCVIDPSAYGLMIKTLCVEGNTEPALDNLHDLVRLGYSPPIITFNSVIRALCAEGRVDKASLVLALMEEGGRVPNRISYDLLIGECNRRRLLLSASTLYGSALKHGVIPDRKPQ